MNISIIGDGGWGTTLAILLSKKGYKLTLWGAFEDYVKYLNINRVNSRFLPGIKIPPGILITNDLKKAITGQQIIIFAVPSQYMRAVLKKFKKLPYSRKAIYLSVTKGIEIGSLKRMSEVIREELGAVKLA
ncbi:MAG: glycerol-3-phosphate dehydrogenase, partial [Candidatus Omnitrophota bacterium]